MKKGMCLLILATGLIFSYVAKSKPVENRGPGYIVESLTPLARISTVSNFLSEEECDHLIELAKPMLVPSSVIDLSGATSGVVDMRRSSEDVFFAKNLDDPVVKKIEERIYGLVKVPPENSEQIQVLHYGVGGEYQPHFDYFTPETAGGKACLARGGQRTVTFIMYLNNPEAGGETIFPAVKEAVIPKKGDALLFYNCMPSGVADPRTLHGGAPVKAGEKWIATKWFRERVFE